MVLLETNKHHWLIKTSMMLSERCASGISFIRKLAHVTMTVRATGSFIHTLCRWTVRNEAVYQIWNGPCNTSISLFQVSKVSWSLSVSSSWKGSPERTPECHSATIAESKGKRKFSWSTRLKRWLTTGLQELRPFPTTELLRMIGHRVRICAAIVSRVSIRLCPGTQTLLFHDSIFRIKFYASHLIQPGEHILTKGEH